MSVPAEKIKDCLILSRKWASRSRCTQLQLRQYLGKLFHVCQCCPTLCLFVSHMLETLRAAPDHSYQRLGQAFKADVHWILQYLPLYNGVQMIPYNPTLPTPIVVDSCLTGGGWHFGDHMIKRRLHLAYPDFVLNSSELTILNALIAIKVWSSLLCNHAVLLLCDNSAALSILQTGRDRASFMLSCARELWSYTAAYNFEIRVQHISGVQNTLADQISCYHSHVPCRAHIDNLLASDQFNFTCCGPISLQIIRIIVRLFLITMYCFSPLSSYQAYRYMDLHWITISVLCKLCCIHGLIPNPIFPTTLTHVSAACLCLFFCYGDHIILLVLL